MARFAPSNEHGDWETAHHVFSYANAVHQALKRLPPAVGRRQEVLRAVFHGAVAVYLARYLNVPPARLPGEEGEEGLDDLPSQAVALQAALLDSFDRRHQVEPAARLVARHLGPYLRAERRTDLSKNAFFFSYLQAELRRPGFRASSPGTLVKVLAK